jgi:TRAP-type mannitol/chloroaromatic compound transport system permease small subunit
MPSSSSATRLADAIDRFTGGLGRTIAWCTLLVVLLQFAAVVLRYLFGLGSIWLQESVLYVHTAVIMLAAAWTLAENGHVRVDIFYAGASARTKARLDLVGTLVFLIPFATTLLLLSLGYAARSWAILEGSREASGIPAVFLLKSLIPAFALTMLLQGIAQAMRAAAVLRTRHIADATS